MATGKTFLLIDDSRTHGFFMERAFGKLAVGIAVFQHCSGEDGVAHLTECPTRHPMPDLVLLDLDMPGGMDGFATVRAIRALSHLLTLPVLMLCGSDDPEHVSQSSAAGADGYVVKPADQARYGELAGQVERWFRAREAVGKIIVPVSCGPGAEVVRRVDSARVGMTTTPRTADQKLIEFTAACEFAGITVARCLNLRQTDKVLDAKRRLVVRWLLSAPQPLPWGELEIGDYLAFSPRYFQERRAENASEPLRVCGDRALLLR